jgi:EGF-like domain
MRRVIDSATGSEFKTDQSACENTWKVLPKCPACPFCADALQHQWCHGRGTCRNGQCDCDDGWAGVHCAIRKGHCTTGVHASTNVCCISGIVDQTGLCCNLYAVLDRDGNCCEAGSVDACGVCGGLAVMTSIAGECCQVQCASGLCLLVWPTACMPVASRRFPRISSSTNCCALQCSRRRRNGEKAA